MALVETVNDIDDCISMLQQSLNSYVTVPIGTKCTLRHLQNMSAMNGKRCKIIGKYDTKQARYPVHVYDTKDTVLIKPCNLEILHDIHNEEKKECAMQHVLQMNVIYDLETGDPDDLFAVLFLISHPSVNVRAVTITPGTLQQVGAIKNLLFNKLNLPPNSVLVGSANPKHKKQCVASKIWNTLCGPIKEEQPDGLGCDIIHQTISKYEDCVIVTGAPLTNLYNYVQKYCTEEGLQKYGKKKLTWICQGGFAGDNVVPKENRLRKFDGKTSVPTWNFNGNLTASQYLLLNAHCQRVFDRRYLVSKNVCHGVYYNRAFHEKVKLYKHRNAALKMIYDGMDMYLRKKPEGKKFHDVLAAVVAVNRNAVQFREIVPCFERRGKHGGEWASRLCANSHIFISVKCNEQEFFETFVALK